MRAIDSLSNSVGVFTETYRYLQRSRQIHEDVQDLKQLWAQSILNRLRVDVQVQGSISPDQSLLFVGNHISYLDIPLLMSSVRNISFVAKDELNMWPVFGEAARRVDTVFVKRENGSSRISARKSIQSALEVGRRVVIFPSGTTCLFENKPWRKGAFEIAESSNCYIQPFRISYSPLRAVAYINKDFFPLHLYNLFGTGGIKAQIEFHSPVKVNNPVLDSVKWHYWSKGILDFSPSLTSDQTNPVARTYFKSEQ